MANVKLSEMLTNNPVTTAFTGVEPFETVVSGVSEAATFAQLSAYPVNEKTVNYELVTEDQGKMIEMNLVGANNLTVPVGLGFPIGGFLHIRQTGAGTTTIVAAGGVTILIKASDSLVLSEQYAQVFIQKTASNEFYATGDLA